MSQFFESAAFACSKSPCEEAAIWPANGEIPENLSTLLWHPGQMPSGTEPVVMLSTFTADGELSIPVRIEAADQPNRLPGLKRIIPERALRAGSRYVLTVPDYCAKGDNKQRSVAFQAGPAAQLGPPLGTLQTTLGEGEIAVPDDASCTAKRSASYVDLTLRLSDAARPYRNVLRYEALADGVHAPVAPIAGARPGTVRVFALCDERAGGSAGLTPGKHRLKMTALLPDDTRLESEQTEVEFTCRNPVVGGCAVNDRAGSGGSGWLAAFLVGIGILATRHGRPGHRRR